MSAAWSPAPAASVLARLAAGWEADARGYDTWHAHHTARGDLVDARIAAARAEIARACAADLLSLLGAVAEPVCRCGHLDVVHDLRRGERTACTHAEGPKATPCGCCRFTPPEVTP